MWVVGVGRHGGRPAAGLWPVNAVRSGGVHWRAEHHAGHGRPRAAISPPASRHPGRPEADPGSWESHARGFTRSRLFGRDDEWGSGKKREGRKRSGRSASASFEAHGRSHLRMRFFLKDEPHPESLTDNSPTDRHPRPCAGDDDSGLRIRGREGRRKAGHDGGDGPLHLPSSGFESGSEGARQSRASTDAHTERRLPSPPHRTPAVIPNGRRPIQDRGKVRRGTSPDRNSVADREWPALLAAHHSRRSFLRSASRSTVRTPSSRKRASIRFAKRSLEVKRL